MQPDDDSQLRAAFAELHQQQRAQAPAFDAMRERALRATAHEQAGPHPAGRLSILRWAAGAVAVCGLVTAIWLLAPASPQARREMETSAAPVDQLIDRIEQHVEYHSALALPEYPSDVLLEPAGFDSSL